MQVRTWARARRGQRRVLGLALGIAVLGATAPGVALGNVFPFTGGEQTYAVPPGVTGVHILAVGAPSGGSFGATVNADVPLAAGESLLYVEVGGPGAVPAGGWGGGGDGNSSADKFGNPVYSTGGGGATDVRSVASSVAGSLSSRVVVAGGAGGASTDGQAGGNAGADGTGIYGGTAGTLIGPGAGSGGCGGVAGDGAFGVGGHGGFGSDGIFFFGGGAGGGGGGGYYGGGGGGGNDGNLGTGCANNLSGGGGGGSSFLAAEDLNGSIGADTTGTPEVTINAPVPVARSLPTITGLPVVGHTLTVLSTVWSNNPTGYAHQWLRCNLFGGSCLPITSATATTYVLTMADRGHRIRVQEVASNFYGAGKPAVSAPTVRVK